MSKIYKMALGAAAAVALCPAAFAAQLTSTQVDAIVGTEREFFITGATAVDGAIKSFVSGQMCAATTYSLYQDWDGSTKSSRGGNWFTMTCTLSTNAAVPVALQGLDVIIHKRTKIGSIYGVTPIANNSYVEFMNIKSTRANACTADTFADGTDFDCVVGTVASGARDLPRHGGNADECDYDSTTAPALPGAPTDTPFTVNAGLDTVCRRGTLGTADVEAEVFQGVNLPNIAGDTFAQLTGAQIASLKRFRTFGQVFGVAVSKGVFSALQAAQGITVADPDTTGTNWPTLTRNTVRMLLTGAAGNSWSGAVRGATFAVDGVAICRREQGSGSQAASNLFFENFPCDANYSLAPKQDNILTWTSGLWVKENTSSTKAKNCLNDAETGGTNANAGNPAGGIGVLSFSGDPTLTGATPDSWRWVKLDGVVPSIENAIRGKYDFWVETQMAYNTSLTTGTQFTFADGFIKEVSKASNMTTAKPKGIFGLQFNTGNSPWDAAANNSAFSSLYLGTNPVAGSKHGSALSGYPASGSPLSCRGIQNYTDSSTGVGRIM
jgi:hypothetical protein